MGTSVLGIDSSLNKTGLCVLDVEEKFVVFDRIFYDENETIPEKTYVAVFDRVQSIRYHLREFLKLYVPDVVSIETPLPVGQMSAGLSVVVTSIVYDLLEKYPFVYGFHPTYLSYLLKKKSYDHSELVALATQIIKSEGFSTSIKRFSADEAVAFLHAFRICIVQGYNPVIFYPRLKDKKEIILTGVGKKWHEEGRLQRQIDQRT